MGFFSNVGRSIASAFTRRPQAPKPEESPRFQRLRELERMYWGEQYEHRGLQPSWDKLTPGRYVPLRAQKPSAQYDLPRLIVDRPTALLFGEGRFPEIEFSPREDGADVSDTTKWLSEVATEGELQHCLLVAARQGARLGTAVITWCVCEGEFEFEPHLAIFCKPTFHEKKRKKLIGLEKRYKFKREVEDIGPDGRTRYVEKDFWHRETWDEKEHVVYKDALAPADGSEPIWEVADTAAHLWPGCPAVWIKNLDDADASDEDGISLLEGLADLTEDIDRTLSQKSRAVRYNQDPERVYFGLTEDQAKRIRIGGGATTTLPAKPGADLALIELRGEGQRVAEEHVVSQRGRTLETARVVAPDSERLLAAARSGAALRILFAPMLELVGEMRTSYGRGLRELLKQIFEGARSGMLQAAGKLETPPPATLPDGKIKLAWGRFFEPTPEDLQTVSTAMQTLSTSELLDHETILHIFASYLGIKDVTHVMEKAQAEAQEKRDQENADMMGMPRPPSAKTKAKPTKQQQQPQKSPSSGGSKSPTKATDDGE
jgi:hypothetical protein